MIVIKILLTIPLGLLLLFLLLFYMSEAIYYIKDGEYIAGLVHIGICLVISCLILVPIILLWFDIIK